MNKQVEFVVEGKRYTLAEMMEANRDDEGMLDWLQTAKAGEIFPAFIECACVAA